jgi:hypothetical protein
MHVRILCGQRLLRRRAYRDLPILHGRGKRQKPTGCVCPPPPASGPPPVPPPSRAAAATMAPATARAPARNMAPRPSVPPPSAPVTAMCRREDATARVGAGLPTAGPAAPTPVPATDAETTAAAMVTVPGQLLRQRPLQGPEREELAMQQRSRRMRGRTQLPRYDSLRGLTVLSDVIKPPLCEEAVAPEEHSWTLCVDGFHSARFDATAGGDPFRRREVGHHRHRPVAHEAGGGACGPRDLAMAPTIARESCSVHGASDSIG